MSVRVIGIDCATKPRKVGVAFGDFTKGVVTIESVRVGSSRMGSSKWDWPGIVATVAREIRAAPRALIALDAPLGWPVSMAASLVEHSAGSPLKQADPDRMFQRQTDRLVTKRLGKKPLDVGANLIARTAHSALKHLAQIRQSLGAAVPLAWDPKRVAGTQVIEVYPAATLLAHGLPTTGYKGTKKEHRGQRETLTDLLKRHERLTGIGDEVSENMAKADHSLDAVVCCLAAADFLCGDVIHPEPDHLPSAEKEGWIWVKPKPDTSTAAPRS